MEESMQYMQRVVQKMTIPDCPTARKTIHQMRSEIKECLIAESEMGNLIKKTSHSETRFQENQHIMKYIP